MVQSSFDTKKDGCGLEATPAIRAIRLTVHGVLDEVFETLDLSDQPCSNHRQAIGTDEECDSKNNQTVLYAVEHKNCQTQNSDERADDAEDSTSQLESEAAHIDHERENYDDRGEHNLQ